MDRADLIRRIGRYADNKNLVLGELLGAGIHGSVFAAEYQTQGGRSAIKGHERRPAYERERDVYLRLREIEITTVRGCHVPALIDYDDQLLVIEMTVVSRPFVLDFAGAYLDEGPDFSDEVLATGVRRSKNRSAFAGPMSRRSSVPSKAMASSCST